MTNDPFAEKLFEMKLVDIYKKYPWLEDEIDLDDFIALFPISYKNQKPVELLKPKFDLDRAIFLDVLVAFKQSFG